VVVSYSGAKKRGREAVGFRGCAAHTLCAHTEAKEEESNAVGGTERQETGVRGKTPCVTRLHARKVPWKGPPSRDTVPHDGIASLQAPRTVVSSSYPCVELLGSAV